MQEDLKKAFDRVSHSFLFSLLEHCDIGDGMRWDGICYRDKTTRLLVNGSKTDLISVTCSVRQGCPMSPVLFPLYLESLFKTILANKNIHGVTLGSTPIKLLAYADDLVTAFSSVNDLTTAMNHVCTHLLACIGFGNEPLKIDGFVAGVVAAKD